MANEVKHLTMTDGTVCDIVGASPIYMYIVLGEGTFNINNIKTNISNLAFHTYDTFTGESDTLTLADILKLNPTGRPVYIQLTWIDGNNYITIANTVLIPQINYYNGTFAPGFLANRLICRITRNGVTTIILANLVIDARNMGQLTITYEYIKDL